MPYVGYSGVANSALTHPGWAEGVAADCYGDIGQGVAGATVVWRAAGLVEQGFILLEASGPSDPQLYVLEENYNKIELENY